VKLVIKIGTNVLTTDSGSLDIGVMQQVIAQVNNLSDAGHDVVLVSSGAVGAGKELVDLPETDDEVIQRQVYSSVGQARLMGIYADLLGKVGKSCSQVLAINEVLQGETRKSHYENMKNCLEALIANKIIPIVNENDVLSLEELMFTDNDELACLVSLMIDADKLIILTNVAGVYDGDPNDSNSNIIAEIKPSEAEAIQIGINEAKSTGGRGGMKTKFDVARRAAENNIPTYITDGKGPMAISQIFEGNFQGTVFLPND
jgi:glutamate 5-kinase